MRLLFKRYLNIIYILIKPYCNLIYLNLEMGKGLMELEVGLYFSKLLY
jgi:hypothetical protein